MAIRGIGVDIVDIARFAGNLEQTSGLVERLFAPMERQTEADLKSATLAGKFAAKEAFIKAVGSAAGMNWHDVVVVKDSAGKPHLRVEGQTRNLVAEAGIEALHLSIAHDGGMAIAYVVAEGSEGERTLAADGGGANA